MGKIEGEMGGKLTCMTLIVSIELYQQGIELPTPEELMGDLDIDPSSLLPINRETGRVDESQINGITATKYFELIGGKKKKLLRETQAHADLVYHFTKAVIAAGTFASNSSKNLLGKYMNTTMESFMVIAYINGYPSWIEDCRAGIIKNKKRKADADNANGLEMTTEEDDVSDVSEPSSKRRFTHNARGKGKYCGWESAGAVLYNMVFDVLEEQRKADTEIYDEVVAEFEVEMRQRFSSTNSSKRKKPTQYVPKVRSCEAAYLAMKKNNPMATIVPI
jgi:hypothetical protein